MKLLFCPKCQDVLKLQSNSRFCKCGDSGGYYVDKLNAVVCGAAIPLGFDNPSLARALAGRPQGPGLGSRFEAFVIPVVCGTLSAVTHTRSGECPSREEMHKILKARSKELLEGES